MLTLTRELSDSIAIPTAATTIQINLVNDTGTIRDNTLLEYWVNDGARTSIALNATTAINGRSALNFNNIALRNLDALPKMTAQELHVKRLDRAGSIIQYDYSFMRLDLPSQLEDKWSCKINYIFLSESFEHFFDICGQFI